MLKAMIGLIDRVSEDAYLSRLIISFPLRTTVRDLIGVILLFKLIALDPVTRSARRCNPIKNI